MKRLSVCLLCMLITVCSAVAQSRKGNPFADQMDRIFQMVATARTLPDGLRSKLMVQQAEDEPNSYRGVHKLGNDSGGQFIWVPEDRRWSHLVRFGTFEAGDGAGLDQRVDSLYNVLNQWLKRRGGALEGVISEASLPRATIYQYSDAKTHTMVALTTVTDRSTGRTSLEMWTHGFWTFSQD